jgi:DHA2 family multidrug resistance protein
MPRPKVNPWLIAASVMIATFMEVMDTSIASVAVPYIAGSTASTTDEAEWVLTVYLVANAVFLMSSTYFSERFGRKKYLMISIVVFTIASVLCGLAPSLGFILGARVIQGAAGGALQPLAQSILIESFPPEKQGQALGLYALGVVLAPVIGPAFGGYLTVAISWRWAFYINVPIGMLAIFLQGRYLEDPPHIKNARPGKLDKIGFGLLGLWVAGMQYMLDKGQEQDWFADIRIRAAIFVMIAGLIAWILYEWNTPKPLVNLRVLKDRNLAVGSALIFILGIGLYALTTILPVFYQNLLGYDAFKSGLAVSPRGLGSFAAALIVGILTSKFDPRKIVAAGFGVLALSTLWLGSVTLDISPWSLFWPITWSGVGLSMVFVPLSKVALGTLSAKNEGAGSGVFNFLRNVGGSVGISAANTISQRHLQTHRNQMIHWFSGANWIYQRAQQAETQQMARHAGSHLARQRAIEIINNSLNSSASLWAYVDVFRYMFPLLAICVPAAFLLKKVKSGSQAAG